MALPDQLEPIGLDGQSAAHGGPGYYCLATDCPPVQATHIYDDQTDVCPRCDLMASSNITEALIKARLSIDQTCLARLSTQTAIERSRHSLAEIRTLLDAFAHLPRGAHQAKTKRITA
jgi:hypothetical protein